MSTTLTASVTVTGTSTTGPTASPTSIRPNSALAAGFSTGQDDFGSSERSLGLGGARLVSVRTRPNRATKILGWRVGPPKFGGWAPKLVQLEASSTTTHTIESRSESSQTFFRSRRKTCCTIISKKSAVCSELKVPAQVGVGPRSLANRPREVWRAGPPEFGGPAPEVWPAGNPDIAPWSLGFKKIYTYYWGSKQGKQSRRCKACGACNAIC